jgi:hypothetical protein
MEAPADEIPNKLRDDNQYLMEALTNLCAFQRVRLYLGVTLLSEIVTADGQFISGEAWLGTRARHSPLLWPFQPKPSKQSIRTLQRLLAAAFFSHKTPLFHSPQKSLHLTQRLDHWLPDLAWLQQKWTSFYSYETKFLYWRSPIHPHLFMVHHQAGSSRLRNPKFAVLPELTLVPLLITAIPVDAQAQETSICFPTISRLQFPIPPTLQPTTPATFQQHIAALPEWERLLIQDVTTAQLIMLELVDLPASVPRGGIALGITFWCLDCVTSQCTPHLGPNHPGDRRLCLWARTY